MGERTMRFLARPWAPLAVTAPLLVLMLLALLGSWALAQGQASALDDFGAAPAFTLTDQLGRPVRSADLEGKVAVANFVYTHCRDTCPLLTARMRALQDRLREERLLGEGVQLLSFAVDPTRDTVPVLREYAERHRADPAVWRFLTGPEDQMRTIVVDGFKLGLMPVTLQERVEDGHADHDHRHDYDVMHSNRFVLIDPQGRVRAYYDGLEVAFDRVVADARALLR